MSLNYLRNSTNQKLEWVNINCNSVKCDILEPQQIDMNGGDINGEDITATNVDVTNDLTVNGVNYRTPDNGQPGYSLHTDGNNNTYWAVDAIGPDGIQYSGPGTSALNKVVKFNSNDGLTATETNIEDDGVSVAINSPDGLTNVTTSNDLILINANGTEIINATPTTTIIKGGGVNEPTLTLRSGLLSSNLNILGRQILSFNNALTNVGYDDNEYTNYIPGIITERIASLIRKRTDATSCTLQDSSLVPRIKYDATNTQLISPNSNTLLNISDGLITMNNNLNEVFKSNSLFTEIKNVAATSSLKIGGNSFGLSFTFNSESRIVTNSSQTFLAGPDGNYNMKILNGGISLIEGLQNRFTVQPTFTSSYSPNGETILRVEDGEIKCTVSNDNRFRIDNSQCALIAPNLTSSYSLSDTAHVLFHLAVGRMEINTLQTLLFSPSRANNIEITDTNTTIKGDLRTEGQILARNIDNTVTPLDIDAPLTQTNSLASFKVNGVLKAVIQASGLAQFDSVFTTGTNVIGTVDTAPLNIGPSSHTVLNIGYSGAPTIINGATSTPNGLTIGASPNQYLMPLTKGTEGQTLIVNDGAGTLAFSLNQTFASVQSEITTSLSLLAANTYYSFINPTTSLGSDNFVFVSSTSTIEYTGNYTLFLRCTAHTSIKRTSVGGGDLCNIAILKNGVKQNGSSRTILDDAATFPLETSFDTIISVSNGDILALSMENENTAGTTVDIYSYSFVVSKISV